MNILRKFRKYLICLLNANFEGRANVVSYIWIHGQLIFPSAHFTNTAYCSRLPAKRLYKLDRQSQTTGNQGKKIETNARGIAKERSVYEDETLRFQER